MEPVPVLDRLPGTETRRSAEFRSEPPEVLQKVFGIFINWSKVRVNVTELLQIKVAKKRAQKNQKQKQNKRSTKVLKMKVRELLRPRHAPTELSNFLSFPLGKKQSGKALTHSIFLFFSGNPAGHDEGGGGRSLSK